MSEIHIERYVFEPLKSNMYLMEEENRALIVDPCILPEVYIGMRRRNIEFVDVILTHEHFDHISGVLMLKKNFHTRIVANKGTSDKISSPQNRIASRYAAAFIGKSPEILALVREQTKNQIVTEVDVIFEQEYDFMWGKHSLHLVTSPGHSVGSICIIMDGVYLFTGDSLIPDEPIITRFPGGNMKAYEEVTKPFLMSLSHELMVYPGHGESMKLGDMLL